MKVDISTNNAEMQPTETNIWRTVTAMTQCALFLYSLSSVFLPVPLPFCHYVSRSVSFVFFLHPLAQLGHKMVKFSTEIPHTADS